MSNLLKALNELGEVKLSSEKVELANVKDISKKLKDIFKYQRVLDKDLPKLEKLEAQIENSRGLLRQSSEQGEKLINDIRKKAKELGLNPESFPDFKQLSIEVNNLDSYLK